MIWLGFVFGMILALVVVLRLADPKRRGRGILAVTFIFAALTFLSCGSSLLVAVSAGHTGVPVIFGEVQPDPLPEGLHVINPFAAVQELSVRTETYTMSALSSEGQVRGDDAILALSKDGLRMPLDVTVAYRLIGTDAPWIYQNLGEDYVDKIIRPAARTAVREATSKFTSQEAYGTKRERLATLMQTLLTGRIKALLAQYEGFDGRGFVIQQVMLRNVDLPPKVKNAIEEKLAAEQDSLRMQFILEKEKQEAERKAIEAKGIAEFQQTVSEGISPALLKWKGIEATEAIARSDNAKVVIVGGGKDGLPVILNTD